jgi:tetratricopeptide (TPR) repeat protein
MVLRSDGAVLIYLWGDDPRSAQWLRQRLDTALRAHSRRVQQADVGRGAGFAAALDAVLAPPPGCSRFAIWVDLPAATADWPLADQWLARVNERRQQLLQWPRPVIVCGPTAYQARAGEVAPDLWSVRSSSTVLPRWPDVQTWVADPAAPWPDRRGAALPSAAPPTALLGLWQQAWQAVAGEKGKGKRLDLSLGLAAAQQLLDAWQLEAAGQVMDQIGQQVPPSPLPDQSLDRLAQRQRWHWLVLQLDLVVKRRQWPAAKAAAQAALAQAERLVKLTGESPEALRDWSVSLDRVGDVQRAMGDVAAARGRYEQSLELRERLVKLTGESPEALSDLATGLGRPGRSGGSACALPTWFGGGHIRFATIAI